MTPLEMAWNNADRLVHKRKGTKFMVFHDIADSSYLSLDPYIRPRWRSAICKTCGEDFDLNVNADTVAGVTCPHCYSLFSAWMKEGWGDEDCWWWYELERIG